MTRYREYVWLAVLSAFCLLVGPVTADLISPAITHVYFEKGGVPWNDTVDYTITCYGYMKPPFSEIPNGSYTPELVFHYSASCKEYGCAIYQPYYLQYTHIDWCDLEGATNNQVFSLQNFSTKPYSWCNDVERRVLRIWGDQREYYYETPEYFSCRQFVSNYSKTVWNEHVLFSETGSKGNYSGMLLLPGLSPLYVSPGYTKTIVHKSDIPMDLTRYINYLETCDPVNEPECPGWIINGKPLKTFSEYRTLNNNVTHIKDHPCDTFLVATDPSLIMPFTEEDPWHHVCVEECNYTRQICGSRFTIPSGEMDATTLTVQIPAPAQKSPAAGATQASVVVPIPARSPTSATVPSIISRSPVESLFCSIVEFFGMNCT